ncbi:MAG: hypothetical protein JXQ29_10830 [Planctomycetes bacterium]|nr:hypothetical protein [Planctomycetota bacterium]
MDKLVLLALVSLALALPAIGQSQAYHDTSNPTGGSANTFPFGNSFGNNWRYQMTVPASSLPTLAVRFVDFAFAPTATGTFAVQDFQLRMEHGTTTALSSLFAANIGPCPINLIDVQGGNYTFQATANQWTSLGAQGSFGYDGQRVLVIEIRYRGFGTTNQGSTSIRSYTSSTNSNRVWANGSYPAPGPADPYSTPIGHAPSTSGGIRVCLTYLTTNVLLADDQVKVGASASIAVTSAPAGASYVIAASLGQGPGIHLGPSCVVHLAQDGLFFVSLLGGGLFSNYTGIVPASGNFSATLNVPNIPALTGICVYHAGVLVGSGSILGCTNTDSTVIL